MTTINEQNAKQIRKPMEVYARMDLSDKSITMTYSGYSSAKIADGKLDQTNWKMRKLTDLQGDGYPLDESCVLYNPNTTASARNGKIGIRGNIGEPVSVTITGSDVMDSVSISVTGASDVTHDGSTSTISGGTSIISVEATTTTLTFTPKSADRRVEISDIIPGIMFNVTNENMISCTLSLRADLSIVDPTLPESEMNLEFYYDEDISETLAAIPEDTPITYRAGYDGDLSPERKFYIADQVTYKDNVVSVHAVDAVHFLDIELPMITAPLVSQKMTQIVALIGRILYDLKLRSINSSPRNVFYFFDEREEAQTQRAYKTTEGLTFREYIAFWMNMIRYHDIPPEYFEDTSYGTDFWFDYVDAGIPYLRMIPSPNEERNVWEINESDIGDRDRAIEKKITALKMETQSVKIPADSAINEGNTPVGTARFIKGVGVSLDFNTDVADFSVAVPESTLPNEYNWPWTPVIPMATDGDVNANMWQYKEDSVFSNIYPYCEFVGHSGIPNGTILSSGSDPSGALPRVFTSFVDWKAYYEPNSVYRWTSMQANWNALVQRKVIEPGANEWSCDIRGSAYSTEDIIVSVGTGELDENTPSISAKCIGSALLSKSDDTAVGAKEMYPKESMENLLKRSNITGSFTWKGDPRMQPRDVFTFVKLDGTEIDCTIEQIDLEHVGGGTTAKITYREGIV